MNNNLPAGRELDRRILTELMGYVEVDFYNDGDFVLADAWERHKKGGHFACFVKLHEWMRRDEVPHFSTSHEDVREVVNHMKRHPEARLRTLRTVEYPYNRTYATFVSDPEDEDWVEANGEHSTPHAICLAALNVSGMIFKSCKVAREE